MKRYSALVLVFMFILSLSACSTVKAGNTENCTVTIGKSDNFTEREIKAAVDAVKTKFKKEYGGCTLLSITYDESNSHIDGGLMYGYNAEDIIYLTSDFITGDKIEPTGFETNMTYEDWSWTVARNKNGKWSVVNWGVC